MESVLRRRCPPVAIGESHRGLGRDRAPPLGAAPEARMIRTPRSSTGSRCWSVGVVSVKLCGKIRIQDVLRIYPRLFLRTIPLPVNEILKEPASASGVQDGSHLIGLLAIDDHGGGALHGGLLLVPLSSRSTGGLEQGDMKGG